MGAQLEYVHDPDAGKVAAFKAKYPGVRSAASYKEILDDPEIKMIVCASIPKNRAEIGLAALGKGKDFFADKPSLVSLDQLEEVKQAARHTGRKYLTYYGDRFHTECTTKARQLVKEGAIGRVVQIMAFGPHRIDIPNRPAWFFDRDLYGGILCDLSCHMLEQFIEYADSEDITVQCSRVANYANKRFPKFEDFGDLMVKSVNGLTGYCRLDWFTPAKLPVWGDGRMMIVGTEGYIELRKYIDIGHSNDGDHLYLVSNTRFEHMEMAGKVGFPLFGQLVLDCLNRTENALAQSRSFKAMELAIVAQNMAERIE
jgi:predicted dehydrogenase